MVLIGANFINSYLFVCGFMLIQILEVLIQRDYNVLVSHNY